MIDCANYDSQIQTTLEGDNSSNDICKSVLDAFNLPQDGEPQVL